MNDAQESKASGPVDAVGALRLWRVICTGVLLLLTVAAICICVRVEVLNARVGGVLPNTSGRKMRAYPTTEEYWRRFNLPLMPDGSTPEQPLTTEERRQMESDIAYGKDYNALALFLSDYGIFQYPLLLIIVIWSSLFIVSGRSRLLTVLGVFSVVSALVCSYFMFSRAYWTSLAW